MRRPALVALVAATLPVAAARPRTASADHRHDHAPARADDGDRASRVALDAGVGLGGGAIRFAGRSYRFATAAVAAELRWRALAVSARFPQHVIELDGDDLRGPGDPHLAVSWRALARDRVAIDASLDAMLPLGDRDRGLGSGHLMVAPGVSATAARGRLDARARVAWATALGDAHRHDIPWPLVAPMNGRQLELDARAALRASRSVALAIVASAALPTGPGSPLADLGGGATLTHGRVSLTASLGHGLLDSPIGLHAALDLSLAAAP